MLDSSVFNKEQGDLYKNQMNAQTIFPYDQAANKICSHNFKLLEDLCVTSALNVKNWLGKQLQATIAQAKSRTVLRS